MEITWNQLERFINTLSKEQKEKPIMIIDNIHETIQSINDLDITVTEYYAHFDGIFSLSDLENEDDDFLDGIFAKIESDSPILVIN